MNSRAVFVFVLLVVLVLYMTTFIRIPAEQDIQELTYLNNTKDIHQEQDFTTLHGQKVLTAVQTLTYISKQCHNVANNSYWRTMEPSGEVWYNGNLNLYYCIVPKDGCTYWKRILRFVSQDYPKSENIKSPADIPRKYVHAGKHPHIQTFLISDKRVQTDMTNMSFMFVRSPYARLWSAYLDKLFLREFNGARVEMAMSLRPYKTKEELICDGDVSFEEFLTAVTKGQLKGVLSNRHWEPIHLLCNPCHVNYTAIGRMEHFTEDANYILTKFGIDLSNTTLKQDRAFEEIKTLTKYNFDFVLKLKNCFNPIDIAERLWKTFQYNGYIYRHTEFPAAEFTKMNSTAQAKQTFMKVVKRTLAQQTEDVSSQKHSMMLDAYRQIPDHLLDAIKIKFKYDFELFGYSKNVFE